SSTSDYPSLDTERGPMRVTSGKSRVRESRLPGSVRAKPNGLATRPRPIVALARRLAVVLHRMWVDGTEFRWRKEADTATAV
ncbi:MAG TPA: hypothetical protein VHW90_12965, partial [Stellaceae bacterium]|nr:hypothetical protein [Stellaceae bacterium]